MPVRNAGPFLEECLTSIIKQSYPNWELHVTNDHSTDDSMFLLQKYSNKIPNIHLHLNDGKGIIDALKTAYSKTKGQLITRMDADDIMPPEKLAIMSTLLLQHGIGHLVTGKVNYFSETKLGDGFQKYETWLNKFCIEDNHFSEIYKECVIPSPCWMMLREDFDKIGAFDSELYPEDYDLCFRMYKYNIAVVSSDQILHHWRDHSSRASRNDENYSDNRFLDLKITYFLELDYNEHHPLIIWGAGKKGKRLAELLIKKNIEFLWLTNNTNKIGKHIYTKKIESQDIIHTIPPAQILLAIANKAEQNEVTQLIQTTKRNHFTYKFC